MLAGYFAQAAEEFPDQYDLQKLAGEYQTEGKVGSKPSQTISIVRGKIEIMKRGRKLGTPKTGGRQRARRTKSIETRNYARPLRLLA